MRLQNKTIIITGASSGIGESAAALFAGQDANVVLGARRENLLIAHAARLRDAGGRAVCLAGDVMDEDYAKALVELAVSEFGGLDVDEVMESLFENDADGTLGEILGPLLGMAPRSEGAANGKPSPKKQNAEKDPLDSRDEADEPTRAKRRLRLGPEAEKKVPAHVRALDVDAFVKSIEY